MSVGQPSSTLQLLALGGLAHKNRAWRHVNHVDTSGKTTGTSHTSLSLYTCPTLPPICVTFPSHLDESSGFRATVHKILAVFCHRHSRGQKALPPCILWERGSHCTVSLHLTPHSSCCIHMGLAWPNSLFFSQLHSANGSEAGSTLRLCN